MLNLDLLDEDGYPTDETLDMIKNWDAIHLPDYHALMSTIASIWWGGSDFMYKRGKNKYYLHTGGWSGNEDIIGAMQANYCLWGCYWKKSERGGHYVFAPMNED